MQNVFARLEDPNAEPLHLSLLKPADALEAAPDFADLIRLWLDRRGDAAVPDWCDMDFTDFRGWHAALVLGAFEDEEPDPRFRLVGEDFQQLAQRNVTGQRFSELVPRLYDLQFREHFRRLRAEGLIGLSEGRFALYDRQHVGVRVLELPFRNGGHGIERTLHAVLETQA